MFCYDGNDYIPIFKENEKEQLLDYCSNFDKYCYFCNDSTHKGRECVKQGSVIIDGQLEEEVIVENSESNEGVDLVFGSDAPNSSIVTLDNEETKIYNYINSDRPLVINFGSRSWLPFVNKTDLFESVYQKFKHIADFLTVYITEAHAADKWKLYAEISFKNPTKIEERIDLAKNYQFDSKLTCPIVVDDMNNSTNNDYYAWPERLYIIQNGKVLYKGGVGPEGYHPEIIEIFLSNYQSNYLEKNQQS